MMRTHSVLYITWLFCFTLGHQLTEALYSDVGPVINLTPSSMKTKIKPNSIALVEFYAPWCGHCKQLKPEWEKAAKALEGILPVAAVDCDAHSQIAGEYGIQGFPTIKLLAADKSGNIKAVADYAGGRTASAMVEWALGQAKKVALKRIGAKASGNTGQNAGSGQRGGGGGGGGGSDSGFYGGTDVVTLTDGNFESEVLDGEDMWFIEFYAPWCGHCKNLKPSWIELAGEVKGKVKVGAVDCTAEQETCQRYGVRGYPTIKWFGTNKARPEDYGGGRDSGSLAAFAIDKWSKFAPPPEVRELTEHELFVNECLGHDADASIGLEQVPSKQLCFIAFLPHILDSKASGRNTYVKILKDMAEKYKGRPFSYFWMEGGNQQDLEANFGVGGFGYPAFVAYSPKFEKFASLRYTFDKTHVKEFIESVRQGFERVLPLTGSLAHIKTTSPWDGQDAEEMVEEEFDLAELMGEEDTADKSEL